jgi:hypothetical protein
MKKEILTHLSEPRKLESMYRDNKLSFKREFNSVYPDLKGDILADFWYERLNFENEKIHSTKRSDLLFVVAASLIAGLIARLPVSLNIDHEFFYTRNIGFIMFPFLTVYFAWKNKLSTGPVIFLVCATLSASIFINLFPDIKKSDTLVLSCIHLLLFLWSILGFAFVGRRKNNEHKRLHFLKFNGDLVVMAGLLLIAGGLLTGMTIGLFELIGFHIESFYFKNVAIIGLSAIPIVATFLTQTNPQLVGKVTPVIARLFSPLVLVMLVIYLVAIVYSGKDPYNDRDFLLMFNALLIGVLAIIFFSIAETSKSTIHYTQSWILFLLSMITILVNCVALSAIVFRISEWGFTPNRAAVLGGNVLILVNLILVAVQLFKVISKKGEISIVGNAIAWYLPIYFIWTIVVTFIFPVLFAFQ